MSFNFEMRFCGQRIKFIEFIQELDVLFPILCPHSLPKEIQVLGKITTVFRLTILRLPPCRAYWRAYQT